MKFYFLFFLLIIIVSINSVSAGLNLAPGKLNFNMETKNEECRQITIVSSDYEGRLKIRDVWASVKEGSNINKFYMNAEDFGIDISYPNEIDFSERETIEVCLSGSDIKEAKGGIIFTPESDTNIVVEVGTWLFVEGESFSPSLYDEVYKKEETKTQIIQNNEDSSDEQNNAKITGAVVGSKKSNPYIIVIVALLLTIFAMIVYYNRKLKRRF